MQEHVLKQLQLKSKELLKHERLVVLSIDEMKGLRHLAHFELISTIVIKIYSFKNFKSVIHSNSILLNCFGYGYACFGSNIKPCYT